MVDDGEGEAVQRTCRTTVPQRVKGDPDITSQPRVPTGFNLRDRALLLALTLAVLIPGIFGVSFIDRDEGWYARVALEMRDTGDWITPYYLGEPWIGKPPLLYWLVNGAWTLLGRSEGAGRLVSVLAMSIALQGFATLAGFFTDRRGVWIASGVMITAILPAVVGRLLITDALLLATTLWAQVALWRFAAGAGARRIDGRIEDELRSDDATTAPPGQRAGARLAALLSVCVAFGILAKGPAIALFCGGFAFALLRRFGAGWLKQPLLWASILIGVGLAAPWYVLVAQRAGDTLFQQFFITEFVGRFVSSPTAAVGPPGYYILLTLGLMMPWSPLAIAGAAEAWRRRKSDRDAGLLLWWLALPWIVLELTISKLPHYVLPCYATLAIMLALLWRRAEAQPLDRQQRSGLQVWSIILIVIAGVGGGFGLLSGLTPSVLSITPALWPWMLAALAIPLLTMGVWLSRLTRHGDMRRLWPVALGGAVVFQVLFGLLLLPSFEPFRLSRNAAEAARATGAATIILTRHEEPTLYYYLSAPLSEPSAGSADDHVVPPELLFVKRGELPAALAGAFGSGVVLAEGEELRKVEIDPNTLTAAKSVSGVNYVNARIETVWIVPTAPASADD